MWGLRLAPKGPKRVARAFISSPAARPGGSGRGTLEVTSGRSHRGFPKAIGKIGCIFGLLGNFGL